MPSNVFLSSDMRFQPAIAERVAEVSLRCRTGGALLRIEGIDLEISFAQQQFRVLDGPPDLALDGHGFLQAVSAGPYTVDERPLQRVSGEGWRPLAPLLWRIGMHGLPDQLLNPLRRRRYRLRRWPDFGRLDIKSAHLRLTSALVRGPVELSALKGVQQTDPVEGFLNACWLCGLLELSDETSSMVEPRYGRTDLAAAPSSRRSLFDALRMALKRQ